ncbi:MAG: M14 family metallopeptidase [Desulfobacula sp.]|nr:M14 family metallopeptidase [Desulfobacula sp.]
MMILKVKKAIKILGFGLVLVLAGAVGWTTYQFHTFTPTAITQTLVPENRAYFQETYMDCRKSFLDEALKLKGLYAGVEISGLAVERPIDPDLHVDYCYIPAQASSERLFILISGVNGVEGYAGSAIQQMFLREIVKDVREDTGLLIIHGVNPFGFKNNRRVTENNVDLNRNGSTEAGLYQSENQGYNDLNSFLNPKHKVSLTSFGNFFFHLTAGEKILRYSVEAVKQAILQGQYRYEKGICYGGSEREPSVNLVIPLIQQVAGNYKMVFSVDLHTGYGENGTLHLFPNPLADAEKKAQMETIFSGLRIYWGRNHDVYQATGEFAAYLEQSLPEKHCLTMTLEFGTLDTHTFMGAVKALHLMMMENQGFHYGYKTRQDELQVKSGFLESYYPLSEAWRSKVIEDSRQVLSQALTEYAKTVTKDQPD